MFWRASFSQHVFHNKKEKTHTHKAYMLVLAKIKEQTHALTHKVRNVDNSNKLSF
jgi:hypothetical protein